MKALEQTNPISLAEAYQDFNRNLWVRQAKVGCTLCLMLVPAGFSLDYFVYPGLFWRILTARLLHDLFLIPFFLVLFTGFGRRHIKFLGSAWVMLPAMVISWMIYQSEGALSPYYAGLNLVMLAACLLVPYTSRQAGVFCACVFLTYAVACGAHFIQHRGASGISIGTLFNNVYFLSLTAIVCVTACHYSSRRRFEDFRLRHELDERNGQLNASYEQLAQMDRLKSAFFANISHELRTPLTLIISPLEEVLRTAAGLPERTRDALSTAKQNALRLLKLISDLLDIVRLEEGRAKLRREPIDLTVFVPAMADSMRHLATVKGLALNVEFEKTPMIVQGDPSGLEKVVLNILTNAIKFTPKDGSISVRMSRSEALAIVEIEDTGIGIPEQSLPHIFDRFHQVDGSSTRKYQGVGIGLALARDLAQQHGGRLAAQSQLGKGTTFRIELPIDTTAKLPVTGTPVAPQADEAIAAAATAPVGGDAAAPVFDPIADIYREANRAVQMPVDGPATSESIGSGEHLVLVVDDEHDMRRFLVDALARDHTIIQAADGLAGLEMARTRKPDLVLLDLMLPGMDGLDVCKALKSDESTKNIKIVLLTARVDEQSKLTALERGADDFLTKPFSTVELQTRLANLLRSAELEEQVRNRNQELETTIKKLQDTEVQLVQSEKMNALGKLSAGLLHEINNPLNFTFMALQMAEQEAGDNSDLQDTLKDIGQGMTRIRGVISDLRTFAYPTKATDREEFSVDEALTSAMRLTAHELGDIPVKREGLDFGKVAAGKTQIIHVFMNLLVNSAQALKTVKGKREQTITVSCKVEGERAQISIQDNGTGVKKDNLPRLFDPFFTTKDVGQGMGLGLSICHTIIKNHGGTIGIESEEGQWARVFFDLPLPSNGFSKSVPPGSDMPSAFKDSSAPTPGSIAA
ncbi:MAG TPA: ATP-binding protein [Tepidisphaeraceae bacterium]|jgi:signal transduction histidine kinase